MSSTLLSRCSKSSTSSISSNIVQRCLWKNNRAAVVEVQNVGPSSSQASLQQQQLFSSVAFLGNNSSSASFSMHECVSNFLLPRVRFMSSKPEETGKAKAEDKPDDATPEEPTAEAAAEGEEQPGPSREEELESQVKELKDRLLRSMAEAENTRQIARKDVDAAKQFAIKSFAKSLLDVSDNLERALEAVPEEARNSAAGDNQTLVTLYQGIEMTQKGLVKTFEMNGLKKYGSIGELFDPNLHEALYEYDDPNAPPGTVGQIMKSGYMLNKRVLRPAEVGVVKKRA